MISTKEIQLEKDDVVWTTDPTHRLVEKRSEVERGERLTSIFATCHVEFVSKLHHWVAKELGPDLYLLLPGTPNPDPHLESRIAP